MQSDYSPVSEGGHVHRKRERTTHSTKAAGYLGVEAVDIKGHD